jgi:hypothetical protein
MTEIQPQDREVIKELLLYDLNEFAFEIGFGEAHTELAELLAIRALNLAERLSRASDEDAKRIALLLCAIVWEHRETNWTELPIFLTEILARMGLLTSALMVSKNGDSQVFASLGSYLGELRIARRIIENRVTMGEFGDLLLTEFQKKMWDVMENSSRFGISAPTSAGKSFILINRILDLLNRTKGGAVFIVPTIALINQITVDLKKAISDFSLNGFFVSQTVSSTPPLFERYIYVLTQERANSALQIDPNIFYGVKYFVIDEVQNIERIAHEDSGGNDRAHDLFRLLLRLQNEVKPEKIIISGPRIQNIDQLVTSLFGAGHESLSVKLPPVVNLTYAFSHSRKTGLILTQYSAWEDEIKIKIYPTNELSLDFFDKSTYTQSTYNLLSSLLNKLRDSGGTLIFSPTTKEAQKSAIAISKKTNSPDSSSLELLEYAKKTVHPNYFLAVCLEGGIAYHHSRVPKHIRYGIENAFKEGNLSTILCTPTLLQGINLPAKNLIAKNPYFYTKKTKGENWKITAYEFANLRGRAGRLLKDFVGRALVLDGNSFSKENLDISIDSGQTVDSSYRERFDQDRLQILTQIEENKRLKRSTQNRDLITYIRHLAKVYPKTAASRLQSVGIQFEGERLKELISKMGNLEVSTQVCIRSPHWDPLILENLLKQYRKEKEHKPKWEIPKNPFSPNFHQNLKNTLILVQMAAPLYFLRHLENLYDSKPPYNLKIGTITFIAHSWCSEKTLVEIIASVSPEEKKGDDIEAILAVLTKTIPYSIPKVIRPLVTIDDETNPLLSFLEFGAYRPITKSLMELGLSREPAILVAEHCIADGVPETETDLDNLRKSIIPSLERFSFWDQAQIKEYILNE